MAGKKSVARKTQRVTTSKQPGSKKKPVGSMKGAAAPPRARSVDILHASIGAEYKARLEELVQAEAHSRRDRKFSATAWIREAIEAAEQKRKR